MRRLSISGSGRQSDNLGAGAPIQVAYSYNTTTGSKVFSSRSTYESVPGTLRCNLVRGNANSNFVVRAHLYWGGYNASIDVAPLFRVFWGTTASTCDNTLGPLWQGGHNGSNVSVTSGANAGYYRYGRGDNNASTEVEYLLTAGGVPNVGSGASIYFEVKWAAGYEAGSRTLYWNRGINTGNAYNPIHTCGMTVTEVSPV